jgi:hypothetical protein
MDDESVFSRLNRLLDFVLDNPDIIDLADGEVDNVVEHQYITGSHERTDMDVLRISTTTMLKLVSDGQLAHELARQIWEDPNINTFFYQNAWRNLKSVYITTPLKASGVELKMAIGKGEADGEIKPTLCITVPSFKTMIIPLAKEKLEGINKGRLSL